MGGGGGGGDNRECGSDLCTLRFNLAIRTSTRCSKKKFSTALSSLLHYIEMALQEKQRVECKYAK